MCGLTWVGIRIPGRELSVVDPTRYGTLGLGIAISTVPTDGGDRKPRRAAYSAAQSTESTTSVIIGVLRYLPSWVASATDTRC